MNPTLTRATKSPSHDATQDSNEAWLHANNASVDFHTQGVITVTLWDPFGTQEQGTFTAPRDSSFETAIALARRELG